MAIGEVRLEGGRQFRRTLKQAGLTLSGMKAAHLDAAQIAADGASRYVPRRTGRLAKTIRPSGSNTAATIRAGNNTKVKYGGPIHWGWYRRHIKPQPFLTRGAQSTEGRWIRVYDDYVKKAIDHIEGM